MKQYKHYTLWQCMVDYSIQDPINVKYNNINDFNKRYCIVDRRLVLDYLEFRNLLEEYGIIGDWDNTLDKREIQNDFKLLGDKNEKEKKNN